MKDNTKDHGHLIWMDLEMTGLDTKKDQIIEIATIITDKDLTTRAYGPELVIQTPKALLDSMDDWCKSHHGKSGLTQKALDSEITMEMAEQQTLDFIKSWVPENTTPLCGNSIQQDRRFLEINMPLIENFLHYRIVDVSSIKELAKRWYPNLAKMEKKGSHTALDDIEESIAELKYFQKHLFIPPDQV